MVEQDAVGEVHAVCLTVVDDNPKCELLGDAIW